MRRPALSPCAQRMVESGHVGLIHGMSRERQWVSGAREARLGAYIRVGGRGIIVRSRGYWGLLNWSARAAQVNDWGREIGSVLKSKTAVDVYI